MAQPQEFPFNIMDVAELLHLHSAMPGLALWRCVLVRSCFFTRDTSCDRKMWRDSSLKAAPLGLPKLPETK